MSGSSEKTEQPTPKKIRDARDKGQVARSQEVVTTAGLFAVLAVLWMSWNWTFGKILAVFNVIGELSTQSFSSSVFPAISYVARECLALLAPPVCTVMLAGFLANYLQFGAILAFDNITPKFERVDPAAGFKRIFSGKQLVETLKSIIKIIFLSVLLYFVLRQAIGAYLSALPCGLPCMSAVTSGILLDIVAYSGIAFTIVAAADFGYQRYSHTKSLKMTKEEVKREYKESEGDPHIKGHRKQIAQEVLMQNAAQSVKSATAAIVNPTHYFVAIRYVAGETPLPIVLAKGQDHVAYFLRGEAERCGVPVFRNVSLARMLHAEVAVDQYVPDVLFGAIAEVLAWVANHRTRLYQGPLGHGLIDMDAGDHRATGRGDI